MINITALENRIKRLEERQKQIVRILQALQRIRKQDMDPVDMSMFDSDENEIESLLTRLRF